MKIHDDIHSRLQSANDFLANVQVMKVSHVPGEVAYEIQVHAHSFTSVISEMHAWVSERLELLSFLIKILSQKIKTALSCLFR